MAKMFGLSAEDMADIENEDKKKKNPKAASQDNAILSKLPLPILNIVNPVLQRVSSMSVQEILLAYVGVFVVFGVTGYLASGLATSKPAKKATKKVENESK